MTIDLTKNPACYVYYLDRLTPSVNEMFYDAECTFPKMLEVVREAVYKAKDTTARRSFLMRINRCISKHELQALCYNAMSNGKSYQPY